MRLHRVIPLALTVAAHVGAQKPSDAARCRELENAATPDSLTMRIDLTVEVDSSRARMTPQYRALLGMGIQQYLVLPRPLSLTVYDARPTPGQVLGAPTAVLTLDGHYRALLHRNGRLTAVNAVGGTRDSAFDNAFMRAVMALSDSAVLPPPDTPSVSFKGDSIPVRFVVAPTAMSRRPGVMSAPHQPGTTPLLELRVPIRRVTARVDKAAPLEGPHYPELFRHAAVEDSLLMEFVIDARGRVDLNSVQSLLPSQPESITAVLEVMPQWRFHPLQVEGCAVSVLIQMPVQFKIEGY